MTVCPSAASTMASPPWHLVCFSMFLACTVPNVFAWPPDAADIGDVGSAGSSLDAQWPHQTLHGWQQRHASALGVPGLSHSQPPAWPEVFKATLFQNRSHNLALTEVHYDWKKGRNLNLIRSQLGVKGVVWDIEWTNGTSFIFTRDQPMCKVLHFDVGILTPDWLANATNLGEDTVDNFDVEVWTKAQFINYYVDKATQQPVKWTFLGSGAQFHVLEFEPGATLTNAHWQAPAYCFSGNNTAVFKQPLATGHIFRMQAMSDISERILPS